MDGERAGGGSLELASLIDDYGQHLVPDLKQYYGIDLRDLYSEEGLDPKWVLTHVASLPIASSFIAVHRGGLEYRGWDQSQYDSAAMIDALNDVAHILILAHRDPDKPLPPPPRRYPRPGDKKPVADNQRTDFKPGSFGDMMRQAKINRRKRLAAKEE